MKMYIAEYESPVGKLLLRSNGAALTGLWFVREPEKPMEEDAVIIRTKAWLDAYFRGENPRTDIPVSMEGTAFQKLIWQLLQQIPYGTICTYGDLAREAARRLGKEKMSAQAVGQAVGKNPISILVPCHRVVGAGEKLTGYAWGIDRKQWLLEHEKIKGGTSDAICGVSRN